MKSTWYSQHCLLVLSKLHDSFNEINVDKNLLMQKARLNMTFNEYKATILVSSVIASIASLLMYGLLFTFLESSFSTFLLLSIPFFIVIGITGLSYLIYRYLPEMKIKNRGQNIDRFLPYAVNYLNTMSSTGTAPSEMFQTLSKMPVYGEIQHESKKISSEIEVMGVDNITALKHAIERSPSEKFKEFIQGLIGTIQSGTSLQSYLSTAVDQYMNDDLQTRKKNLETLGFLAEVFVMTVIAFPIFLVIILTVFSFIGSDVKGTVNVLYILSFLFLPLAYLGFYALIKLILFDTVEHIQFITLEERIKRFFSLKRLDFRVFLLTVGLVSVFLIGSIIGLYLDWFIFSTPFLFNILFITSLLCLGPYGIYSYFELKKKNEIQHFFPEFLTEMSNSLNAGLNVFNALRVAQQSKYGVLTPEIKKMNVDLSWRIPLKNVFVKFAHRLKNGLIHRLIITINKGLFMGGNTSSVFAAVSKELKQINTVRQQRSTDMSLYTIVIIMSFFVFLFIVFILDNTLFSYFFEIQSNSASSLPLFVQDVDQTSLQYGLFSFVFVQSMGAGMLSGYMKEGELSAGIRYSFFLGLITIIAFMVLF
jgi:archaeal flagellar protein FlaJ